jgi:hypothetical protein
MGAWVLLHSTKDLHAGAGNAVGRVLQSLSIGVLAYGEEKVKAFFEKFFLALSKRIVLKKPKKEKKPASE